MLVRLSRRGLHSEPLWGVYGKTPGFAGGCLFVVQLQNKYGEWDSCSLTNKQIEKYSAMFETPIIILEQEETFNEEFSESEEPEITMS